MCGIFGYVGHEQNTAQMILDGLKTLEYRGYDSWGISIKHDKKITSEKHIGKIGDATISLSASSLGIGHTRWATHGGVTVANAHPHTNKARTIAVVHNGIIENFIEIKKNLINMVMILFLIQILRSFLTLSILNSGMGRDLRPQYGTPSINSKD